MPSSPNPFNAERPNFSVKACITARSAIRTGVLGALSLTSMFAATAYAQDTNQTLDTVVVTGRRIESKLSETPQKVDVITREDIERTVATDITDLLKKNSGVDTIQYNGVLSGIGIRGFRPEFSGINKRSLLLIDGRPAGTTNLATILPGNIERIEILKGPSSALYGASAMGGVVNVITRKSSGAIRAQVEAGVGSFHVGSVSGIAGGSATATTDFDVSANYFKQGRDYRMGGGEVRPFTSYQTDNVSARVGTNFSSVLRADARVELYHANDVLLPGDIFNGTNAQGKKDLSKVNGDVRVAYTLDTLQLQTTLYQAREKSNNIRVTSTTAADKPFLPFLTSESDIEWKGAQFQGNWTWGSKHSLVFGLDYEDTQVNGRSYLRTGVRTGPFAADSTRVTTGIYAENQFRFGGGATVANVGGRYDRIEVATKDTPFKVGFKPTATTFTTFNPSAGIKQLVLPGLRAHATVGTAFVVPDSGQLTGLNESIIGGRTQITQGNPNLKPETAISGDIGLEWASKTTRFDVTYFQTKVRDRIASSIVISNPPPPAPVVLSYTNAFSARLKGMEIEGEWRALDNLKFFTNTTRMFSRIETLASGQRDITNVPRLTVRVGFDLDYGPFSARVSNRYVRGRKDQDFNVAGNPLIVYPDFAVTDITLRYQPAKNQQVSIDINNLFDKLYFEKKGFALAGRAVAIKYRYSF